MARFYSECKGGRGAVSRLGHASTGATAYVAGWTGGVSARIYVGPDGTDYVRVTFARHRGEGRTETIYDGPAAPAGIVRSATVNGKGADVA